jgi:hypothetical protein
MTRPYLSLGLLSLMALGGCTAATPTGPTVVAMPGQGQTWQQFQDADAMCRRYAQGHMPYPGQAEQASQQNAAANAAAGTLLGAAAGAALGAAAGNAGLGAAAGAGTGLLFGSAAAGNQTQATANSLQSSYDIAYAQCMVGNGQTIQQPVGMGYAGPGYYAAPPPPPGYYAPY